MTIEVGLIISAAGLVLTFAAFYVGRVSSSKKEGVEQGKESTAFAKDIEYIKQSLGRIESSLTGDIERLSGRVDELSAQVGSFATVAEKVRASAKSAHLRINDHVRNDHGKPVNDWRENTDE